MDTTILQPMLRLNLGAASAHSIHIYVYATKDQPLWCCVMHVMSCYDPHIA